MVLAGWGRRQELMEIWTEFGREFGGGLEKKRAQEMHPSSSGAERRMTPGAEVGRVLERQIRTDVGGLNVPSLLRNLSQPRASSC